MANSQQEQQAPVEVRLLAQRFLHRQPDGSEIMRSKGDVFTIPRAALEADFEPDRGMGRPGHYRTFLPLDDEKAAEQTRQDTHAQAAKEVQDRIATVRESMRQQLQATEDARIRAKAQEAEHVKAAAKSLAKREA